MILNCGGSRKTVKATSGGGCGFKVSYLRSEILNTSVKEVKRTYLFLEILPFSANMVILKCEMI